MSLRLIALLALLPASANAQKTAKADTWAPARATIQEVMRELDLPSVSVAVAQRGKIVWEEAFGWADRERMYPATPHTMYSLASISKPITATGLMVLVERGAVELDRPANDYLGAGKLNGLAGDASGATVRRVLSHTAGLPLHYQFYYANQSYPVVSNDETIARYGIIANPAGEVYEYSNLGYGILDHIITLESGVDYTDFMRANVFIPLGLTRTSIGIAPGLESHVAQRYDRQQRPIPFYDFDHRGASAVYSSAHDLVRFGMFHLKNQLPDGRPILKAETLDLMQRPVAPARYGLGWGVVERDGLRIVSHTGGMPGVQTILALYPAEDVAIVVLTNTSAGMPRIYQAIEQAVVPRYTEARRRWAKQDSVSAASAGRSVPPPELQGKWSGTLRTWDRTLPLTLVVKADGDIHIQLEGQLETLLNHVRWSDGNLVGRFSGTIATSDASRWPHSILLNVRLRDGRLSGMATAQTTADPVYFALSSYVLLEKKQAAN